MINKVSKQEEMKLNLNFDGGITTRHISDTIMCVVERQTARERNQQARLEGTTAHDCLMAITKRLTSGKLTSEERHYHLNSTVLDHVTRHENDTGAKEMKKRRKDDIFYLQSCYIADQLIAKYRNRPYTEWSNATDMAKYLQPLRHDNKDGAMLSKRHDLVQW